MDSILRPPPISWGEVFVTWLCYPALMSVVHLAILIIGWIVLAVAMKPWRPGASLDPFKRLGLILALLLIVGSLFHLMWSYLIWGRIYFSADYFVDFTPFWPITQARVDMVFGNTRGQLLGVSLFQLQLVWLFFAAGTWGVTIFLDRSISKYLEARKTLRFLRRSEAAIEARM